MNVKMERKLYKHGWILGRHLHPMEEPRIKKAVTSCLEEMNYWQVIEAGPVIRPGVKGTNHDSRTVA